MPLTADGRAQRAGEGIAPAGGIFLLLEPETRRPERVDHGASRRPQAFLQAGAEAADHRRPTERGTPGQQDHQRAQTDSRLRDVVAVSIFERGRVEELPGQQAAHLMGPQAQDVADIGEWNPQGPTLVGSWRRVPCDPLPRRWLRRSIGGRGGAAATGRWVSGRGWRGRASADSTHRETIPRPVALGEEIYPFSTKIPPLFLLPRPLPSGIPPASSRQRPRLSPRSSLTRTAGAHPRRPSRGAPGSRSG